MGLKDSFHSPQPLEGAPQTCGLLYIIFLVLRSWSLICKPTQCFLWWCHHEFSSRWWWTFFFYFTVQFQLDNEKEAKKQTYKKPVKHSPTSVLFNVLFFILCTNEKAYNTILLVWNYLYLYRVLGFPQHKLWARPRRKQDFVSPLKANGIKCHNPPQLTNRINNNIWK